MNDLKKINLEIKKEQFKRWIAEKYEGLKNFYYDHPVEAAAIGSAVVGTVGAVIKGAVRNHGKEKEKMIKENYIYDRRHGHYVKLRRAPKQREWYEIDRRKDNGENLNVILQDMRLL